MASFCADLGRNTCFEEGEESIRQEQEGLTIKENDFPSETVIVLSIAVFENIIINVIKQLSFPSFYDVGPTLWLPKPLIFW